MVALVRNRRIETRSCTADGLCSLVQNIAPGGRSTHEPLVHALCNGLQNPGAEWPPDEERSICRREASC